MISKEKKILITGGNGFIGANLVRKLIDNGFDSVFLILREGSNYWRLNGILDKVRVIYGTLDDQDFVYNCVNRIKPNIIYHLAAAGAYIGRDSRGISDLFQTNVLGTINLLNACKDIGFDYFINTGSNSEYGQKNHPMVETDLLEPNNDYGVTKASGSLYCSYIGKKFQLPVYTFRLFAVYGYYEDKSRLIPSLMLNYINNIAPNLSKPDSVRDFIFIEDVINYYLDVDKISGDFGGICNIGSGEQYSIGEIADKVKNISKSNIQPIYGTVSLKQNEPKIRLSNTEKADSLFGIAHTDIDIGLEKSYEWFKNNYALYN